MAREIRGDVLFAFDSNERIEAAHPSLHANLVAYLEKLAVWNVNIRGREVDDRPEPPETQLQSVRGPGARRSRPSPA